MTHQTDNSSGTKKKNFFSLTKYYVDLVTAEGFYFIGYYALLKFGPLKLNYSAALSHPNIKGINSGPILNSTDAPIINDSALVWQNQRLGFEATWKTINKSNTHTLLETQEGSAKWSCIQPGTQIKLLTASGEKYNGLGYAEYLDMTITPWRLGLKILYWGRFITDTHSIVWIRWQGKHQVSLLICNGQKMNDPIITNSKIKCSSFELTLERNTTIREATLGNTIFSKIPSILKLAPIDFLDVKEEKNLSLGFLKFDDKKIHKGWAIHEKVIWP